MITCDILIMVAICQATCVLSHKFQVLKKPNSEHESVQSVIGMLFYCKEAENEF